MKKLSFITACMLILACVSGCSGVAGPDVPQNLLPGDFTTAPTATDATQPSQVATAPETTVPQETAPVTTSPQETVQETEPQQTQPTQTTPTTAPTEPVQTTVPGESDPVTPGTDPIVPVAQMGDMTCGQFANMAWDSFGLQDSVEYTYRFLGVKGSAEFELVFWAECDLMDSTPYFIRVLDGKDGKSGLALCDGVKLGMQYSQVASLAGELSVGDMPSLCDSSAVVDLGYGNHLTLLFSGSGENAVIFGAMIDYAE